ncbi:MAG: DUF3943 domain-containing protein [Bacteroidia bacterium]
MRKLSLLLICFISLNLFAQQPTPVAPKVQPGKADTTARTHYGDLLKDDPYYEKKYPLWIPVAEVIGFNASLCAVNKYIFKYDWAQVTTETWKKNLKASWEWDRDLFGVNFIGHPYTGSLYFNAARSNGYNFAASIPFAIGGSLLWEYFGETTAPSYNDIIATPVAGWFLGEIFYRISSNILNDRKRGGPRVIRETGAAIVNPMRGLNRIFQGKVSRVTSDTTYQADLLNLTLFGGVRRLNEGTDFNTGEDNPFLNISVFYGDPFENRIRKPFDFFKLRTEFNFLAGTIKLDNITGYGLLTGRNVDTKNFKMLYGLFQHYNYWNNSTFELGTITFGGGAATKISMNKSAFYNNVFVSGVPLAGNSTRQAPSDTATYRKYNYSGGLEVKLESSFDFRNILTLSLLGYYYRLYTLVGPEEDSHVSLIKPSISVTLYKNIRAGFEHLLYINNLNYPDLPDLRLSSTEQKIFLMIYFENSRQVKRYD